ncbi:MAG: hypothetical protein HRT54_16410 [Colwellia sp.]|nr:hypothetical protein [Colwellia sp.]
MNKITTTLFTTLLCLTSQSHANNPDHPSTSVIMPINNMFDAMRQHDGEMFIAQFTEKAILERANKENNVEVSDLNKFSIFIKETSKHLDEKIFNIKINQSGNLASAWVPFAFYLDGKLSHCGVNSFQLIKQQAVWKIHYLMDNTFTGDCEKFIKHHKAEEK